jgi:hypothetical protein
MDTPVMVVSNLVMSLRVRGSERLDQLKIVSFSLKTCNMKLVKQT